MFRVPKSYVWLPATERIDACRSILDRDVVFRI